LSTPLLDNLFYSDFYLSSYFFFVYGAKIKETPAVLGQRLKDIDENDWLFYEF
jgi:hypothetical protein